jgi:single-strand DNA-binding protein
MAASFNRVMLMGNLTRDPQLKYLPSQTAVVEFGLATNRKFKTANGEDREEVCFVDCTAFGRQAEVINQYCQKGRPLFIEGHLKFDSWEDKQGGGKRSKLSVVIDGFQLLGSRDGGGGGGGSGGQEGQSDEGGQRSQGSNQRPPPPRQNVPQRPPVQRETPPPQEAPIGDEEHFKESDIPF